MALPVNASAIVDDDSPAAEVIVAAVAAAIRDGWEAEKYGRKQEWRNIPIAYMTDNGPVKNDRFGDQVKEQVPDISTPLILVSGCEQL